MNGEQFNASLAKLRVGDVISYHVGLLMHDRCYNIDTDSVARAAWQAHKDGTVMLFQERISRRDCRYLAYKVRDAAKSSK